MLNDALRQELLAMRDDDLRVRDELVASDELGGAYVPKMEEVHKRNASRLRELIAPRLAIRRYRGERRRRSSMANRSARHR